MIYNFKVIAIVIVVFFFANATAGLNSRACAVLDKRLGIVKPKEEPVEEPIEELEFSMPASFDVGKSELKFDAKTKLNEIHKKLGPLLEKYPNMLVEIIGNPDSVGSDQSNQKLSEERAFNVKLFFITHGIEPERIITTASTDKTNKNVLILAKGEIPPKAEKAVETVEAVETKEEPKAVNEETRNCIYIGVKAGFDMYKFLFGDSRDKHIKMGFGYGGGVSVLFPISEDFTIRHEYNFGWRKLGSEDYDTLPNGSPSEFVLGIFPVMLQYIPFKDLYFEMGPGLNIPILPKWKENGETRAYKDRANVDILIALGIGYYITEKIIMDIKTATSLTWVDAYERKTPFDRYFQFGFNLNYLFE